MSKAKFDAARELIREKKYDEARALLETIDHPAADEWLAKLGERDATQGKRKPKAEPPPSRKSGVERGPIIAVVVLILIAAYAAGTNTRPNARTNPTQQPATGFTPQPGYAADIEEETYYTNTDTSLRSCPSLDCDLIETLPTGTAIKVNGIINGEELVPRNVLWFRTDWNGQEAYIYSGQLAPRPPATNIPTALPITAQPAQSALTCPQNCTEAVAAGWTAEQAGQCSNLDRDGDGVACYGD